VDKNGNAESPAAERLLKKFKAAFLAGVKMSERMHQKKPAKANRLGKSSPQAG
jgi:hypothetical protein